MQRALVLLWLSIAGACTHHPVQAFPSDLRAHAAELETAGRARVTVVGGAAHVVDADTVVTVREPSGPGELVREVSIRELVAGCPPDAPAPERCLADRVVAGEVVVGTRTETHVGRTVGSVVSGLALVGFGALCVAECTGKQVAIGAGVVVLTVGLFALAFSR
jgi:hypothetical protein